MFIGFHYCFQDIHRVIDLASVIGGILFRARQPTGSWNTGLEKTELPRSVCSYFIHTNNPTSCKTKKGRPLIYLCSSFLVLILANLLGNVDRLPPFLLCCPHVVSVFSSSSSDVHLSLPRLTSLPSASEKRLCVAPCQLPVIESRNPSSSRHPFGIPQVLARGKGVLHFLLYFFLTCCISTLWRPHSPGPGLITVVSV